MSYNAYQNYLENEILTADPLGLVVLLYRGAVDAIGSARRHLTQGEGPQAAKSILRASRIVRELQNSLDFEKGGEISGQMARLYEYVERRLLEANVELADKPLAECETLLGTLLEGWEQCRNGQAEVPHDATGFIAQRSELNAVSYAW